MAEQSHYVVAEFGGEFPLARAYWAVKPSNTLILFVHGFGGDALSTWFEFPQVLRRDHDFSGCDLVFYGYDGLYTRARTSGLILERFLDHVISGPGRCVNAAFDDQRRSVDFRYERVLIVGHSLGALIARLALLEAHADKAAWLRSARLILFAPAHMGTDVAKLLEAALAGGLPLVGSLLGFALRWKLAVLADLEEGCQTLTQLREDTKEALASGAEYLRAYRVVLGENDRIVSPNRFVNDPKARVSRGKGHLSVCKPLTGELEFETVEFLEPVQHVRSCL